MSQNYSTGNGGWLGALQLRSMHGKYFDGAMLFIRLMSLPLFLHGFKKLTEFSDFSQGTMADAPIASIAPTFFSVLVVAGQILLPIAIAIGLFSRLSGLLEAVLFVFIIALVNIPHNGLISAENGGLTFDSSLYFFLAGLAVFLLGPGRYSLDSKLSGGRE